MLIKLMHAYVKKIDMLIKKLLRSLDCFYQFSAFIPDDYEFMI